MTDYDRAIIEEFRANGGFEGQNLLLLTTRGRKSGRAHTTPVMCTRDGDRVLVYASTAGAQKHAAQAERLPNFAEYQEKTDRVLPVVVLTRQ